TAIATEFLVKKPADLDAATSRLSISLNPQAVGSWVFGQTAAATDVIYAEQHGNKDEYATQIIACAAHKIESFESLHINDDDVILSGTAATGDYADALWVQTNLGTEGQAAFGDIDVGDNWTWLSTDKGAGIAHYRLRWQVGQEKTSSGIPSRITYVVKGMPVYDPRLDTTVGGSGAHRADDQDTWEYVNGGMDIGENWALVVLSYILGWRNNGILVFGVGADPSDIDYDQVISAANICEEIVDSKKRFKIGGIMPTTNDHPAILKQLEAAIGGRVAQVSGKYYIWAPNDDLATFSSITESDIIRDITIEFSPSGPIEDLYNTARGRYISPEDLYQPIQYPEVEEAAQVTEDGRSRVMARDFSIVQDVEIAERVARHMVRRSRFSGTWRFAMGPKGLIFRPFDVTTINCQETNNLTITVRIINMTYNPGGAVNIECIEEDTSIYDTSAPLGTPITQIDPNTLDPNASIAMTNFTVTAVTLTGSEGTERQAYRGSWDDPGPIVEYTEAQIKISTDTVWTPIARANFDLTSITIQDFEPLTTYDFRIRHVSRFKTLGPWTQIQDTAPTAVGLTHYDDIVHVYRQTTAPSGQGEKNNDLWYDTDDGDRLYRRVTGVWVDIQDDDIAQAIIDAATAQAGADSKIQSFYQTSPPSGVGETEGDFWIDTNDGNKLYTYISSVWVDAQDDAIGTAITNASNAQATADGKVTTFVQTSPPTAEGVGDMWMDTNDNNSLYRWSGASWIEFTITSLGATSSTTLTQTAALVGKSSVTSQHGVYGDSSTGYGVWGHSGGSGRGVYGSNFSSGYGVYGYASSLSGTGGYFRNAGGGDALEVSGIARLNNQLICGDYITAADYIHTSSTLEATSSLGTNGSLRAQGGASIAKKLYVGGHTYLGNSISDNVAIGGATITGQASLAFKVATGGAGSRLANQMQIYSHNSGGDATFAIVSYRQPTTIGTFTPSHKYRIWINALEYDIQLDAVIP
ncbi:MAG: hypothetical protein COA78_38355, partial [Blastopirellula sp.]